MWIGGCFCLSPVSWASDNAFRLLSAFTEWVNKCVFYPLPNVTVRAMVLECILFRPQVCPACRKRIADSALLDAVAAVNWKSMGTFNLKSIVSSCIHVKGNVIQFFDFF